ncbi:hypothetical protein AAE478_005783 [Parahypoxylon ruwenzoriense]
MDPPPANDSDPNPEIRFDHWSDQVEQIETSISNGFSDHETIGMHTIPPYFLTIYSRIRVLLRGISAELAKDDSVKENVNALLDRAVDLLGRCYEYFQENSATLIGFESFYVKIWSHIDALSREPFVSFRREIQTHILRMTSLAADVAPGAAAAWHGDDIRNHNRFQRAFTEFMELGHGPSFQPRDDQDVRYLIVRSRRLVHEALLGLRLPLSLARIPDGLFNDNTRPTYVDFSCHSDEYLYGLGERPGVLSLKLKLGGQVTAEQDSRIEEARGIHPENGIKRPASPNQADPPAAKRARAEWGYTMTMDNVDADIEDCYSDAQYKGIYDRPLNRLVTPTATNRPDTLKAYRNDFLKRIRLYRIRYYDPDQPPVTQALREAILSRLEGGINSTRRSVQELSNREFSSIRLKEARIAAYSLKYLRALHMKLLLSSTPPVSGRALDEALFDRLEDWKIFERAWTEADERAIGLPRTSEATRQYLGRFVAEREANCRNWDRLQEQLESGPPDDPTTPERSEEPEEPEQPGEPGDPAAAGAEEPQNSHNYLASILKPSLPIRMVYTGEKIERRREERMRAAINLHALGPDLPNDGEAKEDEYRREDMIRSRSEVRYKEGGPAGFGDIPKTTVFDKLAYMIILTHWRCYIAKDFPV